MLTTEPIEDKLFSDIALQVLELRKINRPKTVVHATYFINRLIQTFGHLRMSELTEPLWGEYVLTETEMFAKRRKRIRTFYDDRKFMRMILLYASRHGIFNKHLELQIPDRPSEVAREITEFELKKLLKKANPQLAFQIRIAFKMGLRLREMLFLKWDRFNWERGTIKLQKEDTKTRRGREVPITPELVPKFRAMWELRNSTFVFPHRFDMNRPQHDNKSAWVRLKRECRIKARWHDLRHSCATVLLRKGVPDHVIRRYLGMSSRVLHAIYAHLSIDDLRQAAQAMNEQSQKSSRKNKTTGFSFSAGLDG